MSEEDILAQWWVELPDLPAPDGVAWWRLCIAADAATPPPQETGA